MESTYGNIIFFSNNIDFLFAIRLSSC